MKTHNLILATCILLMIAGTIHSASFDCGKATTEVEKIICGDDELSKLDESLNKAYLEALKRIDLKEQTIKSQSQWLKNERNACQDLEEAYETHAECIREAYETRIKELSLLSSGGRYQLLMRYPQAFMKICLRSIQRIWKFAGPTRKI